MQITESHRSARAWWRTLLLLAVAAVAVAAAGCAADEADDTVDAEPALETVDEDVGEEMAADAPEPDVEGDAGAGADVAAEAAETDRDLGDYLDEEPDRIDDDDRYLIREGSATVRYEGTFEQMRKQLRDAVEDLGGAVGAIRSDLTDRGDGEHGSIEVSVPVDRYDDLLDEIGDMGEVIRRDIDVVDATGDHADLESQLRSAEEQEERYLEMLDDADSTQEELEITDRLEALRRDMEQLRARIDGIEARAAVSTITVRLVPYGYDADVTRVEEAPLTARLRESADAFVGTAGTILVGAAAAAPWAIVLAALLAVAAGIARRRGAAWRGVGSRHTGDADSAWSGAGRRHTGDGGGAASQPGDEER